MIKGLENISLLDILPENISADQKINAAAKALDAELQKLTRDTAEAILLARLDELPENVLDLLAWQWHVDFYEPLGMDAETKRKLIKNSIAWHRIKGTAAAVQKMVEAAWNGCSIEEWFDYDGEPYHFRVMNITAAHVDEEVIWNVLRAIWATKNVRSWLDGINFLREADSTVHVGAIPSLHWRYIANPKQAEDTDVAAVLRVVASPSEHRRIVAPPRISTMNEARATPSAGGKVVVYKRVIGGVMNNG
ncbi:MAG: phage tail protein I [Oscillospiraceae bacterium]|nr:phage tail protein I [Oscillospiraceae bacterium]